MRLWIALLLLSLLTLPGTVHAAGDEFPAFQAPASENEGSSPVSNPFVGTLVTSGSALIVVLAIFGAFVWVQRRYGSQPDELGAVPETVIQRLGTVSLDSKTQASIVKFGDRLLLIGQTTSGQMQTLAEITDPDEVARMTNRCLGRPEIVGRRTTTPRRNSAAG